MITRNELKIFRKDFESAVESLENKYGVKIELGAISYGEDSFHGKMTCTKVNANGEKKVDTKFFELYKSVYGLKANIGDSYTDYKGVTYVIYDVDPKKPKYPVLLRGSDGKTYKSTVDGVNLQLSKKTAS
jgi:hypothetical protein